MVFNFGKDKISSFKAIRQDLREKGISGPHKFFDSDSIVPIQKKIYSSLKEYIIDDSINQPLSKKLSLPLKNNIPSNFIFDLKGDMQDMVLAFARSPMIKEIFIDLFGHDQISCCKNFQDFRGNFPEFTLRATGWHQDAAASFADGWEEWRHPFYIMWVSLNGAEPTNSLEIINGSHKPKRLYSQHYSLSKRVISDVSKDLAKLPTTKISCQAGEVFFFDSLVFHRSILNKDNFARFSLDVRYYDPTSLIQYSSIDKGLYWIMVKSALKNNSIYKSFSSFNPLRRILGFPPR